MGRKGCRLDIQEGVIYCDYEYTHYRKVEFEYNCWTILRGQTFSINGLLCSTGTGREAYKCSIMRSRTDQRSDDKMKGFLCETLSACNSSLPERFVTLTLSRRNQKLSALIVVQLPLSEESDEVCAFSLSGFQYRS